MPRLTKPIFLMSLTILIFGTPAGEAGAQGLHDGGTNRILGLRHIGLGELAYGLGLPAAGMATDAAYGLYHRPYDSRPEDAYGQPYGAYGPYGY